MTTRAEHLEFCKERALAYAAVGDTTHTMASMQSDLSKHPDTVELCARAAQGTQEATEGRLTTPAELLAWVESFQ